MIKTVLGLLLFALAVINYSSLHTKGVEYTYNLRSVIVYLVLGTVLFIVKAIYNTLVVLGYVGDHADTILISYTITSIFGLTVCMGLIVDLYRNRALSLNKEGFNAIMHVIIISLFIDEVHASIPATILIFVVIILTFVTGVCAVLLVDYSRKLYELVDFVDISSSLRILMFSCMLYGVVGVVSDFQFKNVHAFLLAFYLSLLISFAYLLKELMDKYIKPLMNLEQLK